MFSILSKVYTIRHTSLTIFTPPQEARSELSTLVNLVNFIKAYLKKEMDDSIICTDASIIGGDVVYCDTTESNMGNMPLQSMTDQ